MRLRGAFRASACVLLLVLLVPCRTPSFAKAQTSALLDASDKADASASGAATEPHASDPEAGGLPARGPSSKPVDASAVGASRPFLALRDTVRASAKDAHRLYEQAGQVASVAYLLFGAAEPLSRAQGSSSALLPYLNPTILRLYASRPNRCGARLTRQLYELTQELYGTDDLRACHYTLYTALRDTFGWVRDNVPLRIQQVEGQPLADAAWTDQQLVPDLELTAALVDALADEARLGEVAAQLSAACGLHPTDFAALVPRIASVLAGLHADLTVLQGLASEFFNSHWEPDTGESIRRSLLDLVAGAGPKGRAVSSGGGGAAVAEGAWAAAAVGLDARDSGARRMSAKQQRQLLHRRPETAGSAVDFAAGDDASDADAYGEESAQQLPATTPAEALTRALERRRRRQLVSGLIPANYFYDMPPSSFTVRPPSDMAPLYIPLVFHVMLYTDNDGVSVGPDQYGNAASYLQRLVRIANYMTKPTKIQFWIKEVRSDPGAHPYLLLLNRQDWLDCPNGGGGGCLASSGFVSSNVADFPRSINVFIVSDSTAASGVPLGRAFVPGSDVTPGQGHVFMTWDGVTPAGSNSARAYNDGPNTLAHELMHHLGLQHTFGMATGLGASCSDDDYILDTPSALGSASSSSFAATATQYCLELFFGVYGGDWDAAYARWAVALGIPAADMNAWADSCPNKVGYDELGNYMTYNTAVCFAALGHFTPGQAQRMHHLTAELNPVLYGWGQYYAATSPPPPPAASPPPEADTNICTVTRGGCACKASWVQGNTAYAYCDRTGGSNALFCEVASPSSCANCTAAGSPCVLSCAGTARQCRKSLAPGTANPPPPPPRPPSPPPMPPPPPPAPVPSICMMSASGCPCRSTWAYSGQYVRYCAAPDGASTLWCQVDPSCPSFSPADPYQDCAANLSRTVCGDWSVRFTSFISGLEPPSPPPAPPSPPPSPPAPPPLPWPPNPASGAVARTSATLVLAAPNCSAWTEPALVRPALLAELAVAAKLAPAYVDLNSAACVPAPAPSVLAANWTIAFPPSMAAKEIAALVLLMGSTAAMAAGLSPSFQAAWGSVASAAYLGTSVLQRPLLAAKGPLLPYRLDNATLGAVQVLLPDGTTGLICNADPLTTAEAAAVCRNLGFAGGVPATPSVLPPVNDTASPTLFLDGLSCGASAASIAECASAGWAVAGARCNRETAFGVSCSGGVAALLDVAAAVNVSDCAGATIASSLLLADLFVELAANVYKVPASALLPRDRPSCVRLPGGQLQVRVNFSVAFPVGATAKQVDAAQDATSGTNYLSVLSTAFQSRWGAPAAATEAGVVVVAPSELCEGDGNSGGSRTCGPDSGSNPPLETWQIVLIAVGGFLVLVLIGLAVFFVVRRSSARVQHHRESGWDAAPPPAGAAAAVAVAAPPPGGQGPFRVGSGRIAPEPPAAAGQAMWPPALAEAPAAAAAAAAATAAMTPPRPAGSLRPSPRGSSDGGGAVPPVAGGLTAALTPAPRASTSGRSLRAGSNSGAAAPPAPLADPFAPMGAAPAAAAAPGVGAGLEAQDLVGPRGGRLGPLAPLGPAGARPQWGGAQGTGSLPPIVPIGGGGTPGRRPLPPLGTPGGSGPVRDGPELEPSPARDARPPGGLPPL